MIKHVSKLVLGASLVTSMLMGSTGSTGSASANEITKSDINASVSQPMQLNEINEVMPINEINEDERANHVALNAAITNNGQYWLQPGGYPYARINVQNTGTQPLKVYIEEDGFSQLLGTVAAKGTSTWTTPKMNYIPANGKKFFLNYSTANGKVSGVATVRVSSAPL